LGCFAIKYNSPLLSTEQQLLCRSSLLFVLEMDVDARDSQGGMAHLIFGEVCGHPTSLHVAYPTVPEGVHSTASYADSFADRVEN